MADVSMKRDSVMHRMCISKGGRRVALEETDDNIAKKIARCKFAINRIIF